MGVQEVIDNLAQNGKQLETWLFLNMLMGFFKSMGFFS